MEEISAEQLKAKLEAGENVSVVDIRERDEYADWHISGSSNVPVYDALRQGEVGALVQRAAALSKDVPVVTVCRMGVVSRMAAQVLSGLGFRAASLNEGMRGWGGVWSEARVAGRLDPAVVFYQIRRNGKGCLSYLVGSRGAAAVIDPCVDVEAYTRVAEREGLRITHVLETHVHADHVSRARALGATVSAALILPSNRRVQFAYTPTTDGEVLALGDVRIETVATPGHTGESVCYLVDGKVLLTGDTLFLDAVGRPDLERGDAGAETGARQLHASLRKLRQRLGEVWIFPAHHGGPIGFDRSPVGRPFSEVRERLELFGADVESFVSRMLESLQAKPPNHDVVIAVNEGRTDLGDRSPLDLEAGPNRCAAGS